jgi:hypothetical protein
MEDNQDIKEIPEPLNRLQALPSVVRETSVIFFFQQPLLLSLLPSVVGRR